MDDTVSPGTAVAPLHGELPSSCGKDVASLQSFIRSRMHREILADAVSADSFREVLLTGATGFVGRYFLSELLETNPQLTVHCLVRGTSDTESESRLKAALEAADLPGRWQDRICIVTGDINEPKFGLSSQHFAQLCDRIDAIYHLAADLSLVSSYANLRVTNTVSLRNIVELSLTVRLKHVFYASTMAVFPEYFCHFKKEFATRCIENQVQPDVDLMKRLYPLGICGYPWSKLVVERALLYAQSAGLPIAIFRLPVTGVDSNGFTQATDLEVRIGSAMNDVEAMPQGLVIHKSCEPVDTLARICIAISTNPNRQFTIYHCCDPRPDQPDVSPEELGLYFENVSYRSFKRACLKRGKKSPLHGLWPLLDHFSQYWFAQEEPGDTVHVDDHAIQTDCPVPIRWENSLTLLLRTWKWVGRHLDQWPYSPIKFKLESERLLVQAEKFAQEMEVDFDETYPPWMRTGLRQFVQSFETVPTQLLYSAPGSIALSINHDLRANANLARERKLHPEINEQRISQPVFILGINRTGTTFLHRLLARDPQFWSLKFYEMFVFVLTGGDYAEVAGTADDPRRESAELFLEFSSLREAMAGIHHFDIDEPEEELSLFDLTFLSWTKKVRFNIPQYHKWLMTADFDPAYQYHLRIMQHYNWRRRLQQPNEPGKHWLLKMPLHLMELDSLLRAYPDARFIQTHRAPVEFMGSWASLVKNVRAQSHAAASDAQLGCEQLEFMGTMMSRALDFRARHPELADRWVDIRFSDLVKSPFRTISNIYSHFNWSLEPGALDAMTRWHSEQAEKRKRESRHQYQLSQFGLTQDRVDDKFKDYLDFVEKLDF